MDKIATLRELFSEHNIDAYLVPSQDEYQNEYVPEHRQRLKFVSDFSGSNGIALVTTTKKILFTDGRYFLQAKLELTPDWQILNYTDQNIIEQTAGLKVGFDPKLHSLRQIESWKDKIDLVPIAENLIGTDPTPTNHKIFLHDLQYCGISAKDKISSLVEKIQTIDALVITAPDSISWLLNIRGDEVKYNPVVLANIIIYRTGHISLFLEQNPSTDVLDYLDSLDVIACPINDFENELKGLRKAKIQICDTSSYWLKLLLPETTVKPDPCLLAKACKNEHEIKGAINAHIKDGRAVTNFLKWLEKNYDNQDEISVAEKLLEFRKEEKDFISPSFATIAGFAANGAIIHYHAQADTAKKITGNGLLLLDSGGQYLDGTTDITRTIAIGTPTSEQIHNFTLVLKGFIALASAEFAKDTTGTELDALARQYLLAENKDYAHGTGHGVGSFLSVHEGPQRISKSYNKPLVPNMIVSIEPGYYKEGEYGIRIENLVYVIESEKKGFLKFEMLTKVPLDHKLIDLSLLTEFEKDWLNSYEQDVQSSL